MRDKMQAEQDLVHFEDEDRPMQERGAREDVKEITESLAYAQEELNQLKKMYEKDNLTEETEEIILRRAENTVARYQWMLEQTAARTERTLNVMLPRTHESLKRSLEMRQIDWRAGEKAMRDGLEKLRLSTAAKRREMEETRKALAEHEEDLAAMRVTAPHDGIVYYGMSQRAKWTTASIVDRKLIPGGKLSMREIVMTIVDPSKVRVLLSLTEEQLADLAEGQTGVCQAKWKPDVKFGATLESILYVPYADKSFDAVLSLKTPKEAPALLPGMSVDAELVVYEKADALTVPKAAVKKEGERELVTLADGKTVTVKTGRAEGDRVEILEGLKAGAVVRLPEVKKDAAEKESKPDAPSAPAKKE
jgi:multidrug efflux pump subunit AcrA (membrane-fusion protein)